MLRYKWQITCSLRELQSNANNLGMFLYTNKNMDRPIKTYQCYIHEHREKTRFFYCFIQYVDGRHHTYIGSHGSHLLASSIGEAARGEEAHNVFNDGIVESRMPPKCSSHLLHTVPIASTAFYLCLYRFVPVYTKALAAVVGLEFLAAVSQSVPRDSVL